MNKYEYGAPDTLQTEERHLGLVTVLETNTECCQQWSPGHLEHGLHVLVIRGGGEVQLHVTGALHQTLGCLRDALQLHVPQQLLLLAVQEQRLLACSCCLAVLAPALHLDLRLTDLIVYCREVVSR